MSQVLETKPRHVTDETFEENVLAADRPVLVDFWAPWCGPCHAVAPILEELAEAYAGKVDIVKVNVDENPQTAGAYQIRSIPTLLLFKDGQVVDGAIGVQSKSALESFIRQHT